MNEFLKTPLHLYKQPLLVTGVWWQWNNYITSFYKFDTCNKQLHAFTDQADIRQHLHSFTLCFWPLTLCFNVYWQVRRLFDYFSLFLNYSKGYEWICMKIVSEVGLGPALKDFTFGFNLTLDTLDFSFFLGKNWSNSIYSSGLGRQNSGVKA